MFRLCDGSDIKLFVSWLEPVLLYVCCLVYRGSTIDVLLHQCSRGVVLSTGCVNAFLLSSARS